MIYILTATVSALNPIWIPIITGIIAWLTTFSSNQLSNSLHRKHLNTEFSDFKLKVIGLLEDYKRENTKKYKNLERILIANGDAERVIKDMERIYANGLTHCKDELIKVVITDGANNTLDFARDLLNIGIENLTEESIRQKIQIRSSKGKKFTSGLLGKEFTKNWEVIHYEHAIKLINNLLECIDRNSVRYKYNNINLKFGRDITQFMDDAITGIIIEWEKYKAINSIKNSDLKCKKDL